MKWFLFISAVALAGQVVQRADSQESNDPTRPDAGMGRADTSGAVVTLPSEGRGSDAVQGVVVILPGPSEGLGVPEAGSPKVAEGTVPTLPPVSEVRPPVPQRAESVYPPGFESDSALFCQAKIGQWKEDDVRALLGESTRERLALGEDQSETGLIYAFADPTGRYKELELDFTKETGVLRSVFAYPWKMTWQECRRIWGFHVNARKANNGRTFYSYLNRRLDVLVDGAGKVISLGLY